jgi:uncharacterized protein with PCYCGC motif
MDQSSKLVGRRSFLVRGALIIGSVALTTLSDRRTFGAAQHRYKLAPESVVPVDIRQAPVEVRDAYRFAVANRDVLRYVPCYCGCEKDGHTNNASCYLKDSSPPGKPEFDPMSLG